MPIEYWILESEDLTYARWSGSIAPIEMRRNFEAYLADPQYRAGRPELIDLLGVTTIDIGLKTMVPLLGLVNSQKFGGVAGTKTVVLTKRKVIFGIARMYQLLAGGQKGIDVHVFEEEAEALACLGRSECSIAELTAKLPITSFS